MNATKNAMNNGAMNPVKIGDSSESRAVDSLDFLSYCIGSQEYGIDMRAVQELRPFRDVTWVADGTEVVGGVIISRGVIMPLVDMRATDRFIASNDGQFPILVVLNLFDRSIGMVVDKVVDIVTVNAAQVTPASCEAALHAPDYLIGLGDVDARRLILLDIEKMIARALEVRVA